MGLIAVYYAVPGVDVCRRGDVSRDWWHLDLHDHFFVSEKICTLAGMLEDGSGTCRALQVNGQTLVPWLAPCSFLIKHSLFLLQSASSTLFHFSSLIDSLPLDVCHIARSETLGPCHWSEVARDQHFASPTFTSKASKSGNAPHRSAPFTFCLQSTQHSRIVLVIATSADQ